MCDTYTVLEFANSDCDLINFAHRSNVSANVSAEPGLFQKDTRN